MDVNFDSSNTLPETYDYINDWEFNPILMIILTVIVLCYYFLFSSLGVNQQNSISTNSNSDSGFFVLEVLLWSIFIVLVLLNGVRYFFGISVNASIKKLFSKEPQVDFIIKNHEGEILNDDDNDDDNNIVESPSVSKQVFNIPGNKYTYNDAKALCKAYDSKLATYKNIETSYRNGGEWCNYGWSADQMVLFPTQKETWKKLQKKKGHKHDCGRPGVNGGYIDNPNARFGVNCYGYRPGITANEAKMMKNYNLIPKTKEELEFEKKVDKMKTQIPNILISPFNKTNWGSTGNNSDDNIFDNDSDNDVIIPTNGVKANDEREKKEGELLDAALIAGAATAM